ncbi:MAG: hypothetical protein V1858_02885 [Candidatus Gottesmanbacteria bacterium]
MRTRAEIENRPSSGSKLIIWNNGQGNYYDFFNCGGEKIPIEETLGGELCLLCGVVREQLKKNNITGCFTIFSSDLLPGSKIQAATKKDSKVAGVPLILKIS